jgi:beta-lactam-binding protein with PASTA domain
MLSIDMGLGAVLILLGVFMVWRLIDLFAPDGVWHREFKDEKERVAKQEMEEQKRKLAELQAALKEVTE